MLIMFLRALMQKCCLLKTPTGVNARGQRSPLGLPGRPPGIGRVPTGRWGRLTDEGGGSSVLGQV